MLIFLLSILLFVAGGIGWNVYGSKCREGMSLLCFVIAVIGCLVFLGTLIAVIVNNVNAQIDYENVMAEREIIVYQLDHKDTFLTTSKVGVNELVYNQVKEFNRQVRVHKFYRNSPWTSWYEPSFWNEIELIDYEGS